MSPWEFATTHRQLAVVIALAFGPACTGMDEPGGEPPLEDEGEDDERPGEPAGGLSPSGRDAALAATNGVAQSTLVFDFDGSNPVLYSSGGWMLHSAAPPSDQSIEVSFSSQALGTDGNRSSPYPGYDDENSFVTVGPITLGTTLSMRSWHVDEGGGYYDRKRVFFQSDAGMISTWVLADCANEVPTAYGMPANSDLPFCQFYSASRPGELWDEIVFDTDVLAGQTGTLRFEYQTLDGCCGFEQGWFIDDIVVDDDDAVEVTSGPPVPAVGFNQCPEQCLGLYMFGELVLDRDAGPIDSCTSTVSADGTEHQIDGEGGWIRTSWDHQSGTGNCFQFSPVAAGYGGGGYDGHWMTSAEAEDCGALMAAQISALGPACNGSSCGNGSVEGSEQCDGGDVGGNSCGSLGLGDGWLGCTPECTFDTSSCVPVGYCGNWSLEGSEQCDSGNLGGNSCSSLGLGDGWLGCTSECTFDTSSCVPVGYCGNWSIEGSEQCDGGNLGGNSCSSLGLVDGWLGCTSECTFDTSSCISVGYCGDGNIEGSEQCDGGNLGGNGCAALGLGDGVLGCTAACNFDPSACLPAGGGGGSPGDPAECGNPSGGPLAWTNGTGIPGEVYCYEADDTVQELAQKACASHFGEDDCCIITGGYQDLQYGSCTFDGYGSSIHWHMDNHPAGHCGPEYVVGDVVSPGWCGSTTGNFLPAPQDPNACPAACLGLPMWQELVEDPAAGPIDSCYYSEYGSAWYLEIVGEGGYASAELDTNTGGGTCTSWSPATGEQTVDLTFMQANACTTHMYFQIDALGPACEDDTPVCGNGVQETGEQCDGADLNGTECASNGWTGTLACSPICTFDWGSCNIPPEEYCGNWAIEGSEQCDSGNLGGNSCGSLGLGDGWLGCSPSCTFDTSSCVPVGYCGNWSIEGSEQCDSGNLGGNSCSSLGLGDGWLGCSPSCTFDTSSCVPVGYCGNWSIEGSEQCDGGNLGGNSCSSLGLVDGWLGCTSACTFDTSSCISVGYCGDGNIEGSEQCDGDNLGGTSCGALGFGFGSVGCSPACAFDTSACVPLGVGDSGPGDPESCGNPTGGALAWTNGTGIPGEVYCFQYGDSAQVLAEKACESHYGEGNCCIITGGYQDQQYGSCALEGSVGSIHWHWDEHPEGHCGPEYVVGDVVAPGWCGIAVGNFLPEVEDPNACPAACLGLPMWQELVEDPAAGPIDSCYYSEYGSAWYLEIVGEGGYASAEVDTNTGGGTCTSWSPATGEQTVNLTFMQAGACTTHMYFQIDALGPACEDDTPVCGNGVQETGEQCDGADLNGAACADNGWTGTLACSPICTFDWGSCNIPPEEYCGNGVIEGSEQCDGPNLGGITCGALGFGFGSVGCSPACAFDTSACLPLGIGDSGPGDPESCGNPTGGALAWTNGTGIPGEVYCFQYGDSAQVLAEKACESHYGEGNCCIITGGYQDQQYGSCALEGGVGSIHWHWDDHPEGHCGPEYEVGDVVAPGWCGIAVGNFLPDVEDPNACPAACIGLPMWQELVEDPAAGPIESCYYSEYGAAWYLEIVGEDGYASAQVGPGGSGTCKSWTPATGVQTVNLTFMQASSCTSRMYFQIDALGPACEDDTPVCGNGVRETGEHCDGADLNGAACADYGWTGTLTCTPICTLNLGSCNIPQDG